MVYMGSKSRISKDILPIILKDRKQGQCYVELFAGGMNLIDKVDGDRIANDNNKYLIALWEGLQINKSRPTEISKEFYSDVRDCFKGKNSKYDDFTIGWVGFIGSANGRFFEGGYSGKSNTKIGTVRDYIAESIRNIEKQIPNLKDVDFRCGDYRQIEMPENSIVYADPPYEGTKQYPTSKGFNYLEFWDHCRDLSSRGHEVYISEYKAPEDFVCLWEKKIQNNLSKKGGKKATEKLFIYDPLF